MSEGGLGGLFVSFENRTYLLLYVYCARTMRWFIASVGGYVSDNTMAQRPLQKIN